VRGARLALRRDDLLVPQLRALYRAAMVGPLSVMFPMISTVEEVLELRRRMEAVRLELGAPVVPVGIMIEVPSAALMADRFAPHVDFFSIGTNDLTQYVLAVDRQHPELAGMADSLHPSVLRLIERTVDGARRHGKWVGVCGGLAGEPLGAALLAGLGVDELSMSTGDIGSVKALLRRHSIVELQAMAKKALDVDTADEVRALGSLLRPAPAIEDDDGPGAASTGSRSSNVSSTGGATGFVAADAVVTASAGSSPMAGSPGSSASRGASL
jgi:phosphocarrier protein FPr